MDETTYVAPAEPAPQQGSTPAPQPTTYAPAPGLTGGQKAGWFFVGFLSGITGILIAWLTNADKPQTVKSAALKFTIIGFVATFAIVILMCMFVGCASVATVSSLASVY